MKKSSILMFIIVFIFINLVGLYIMGGMSEMTVKSKLSTNLVAIFLGIAAIGVNESNKDK